MPSMFIVSEKKKRKNPQFVFQLFFSFLFIVFILIIV